MSHIHIYAPRATAKHIHAGNCPDCKKRTQFIGTFTPWYGSEATCLRCGRNWQDGHWMPLEFVRQSRQRSIDRAKKRWRSMPPMSKNHYGVEV